jgi:hypothetical protein
MAREIDEPKIDVTVPADRRGDASGRIHRDVLDGSETMTRNGTA